MSFVDTAARIKEGARRRFEKKGTAAMARTMRAGGEDRSAQRRRRIRAAMAIASTNKLDRQARGDSHRTGLRDERMSGESRSTSTMAMDDDGDGGGGGSSATVRRRGSSAFRMKWVCRDEEESPWL
ncbi:hypothetical protein Scep_019927 [Stephania cephalantha]|uniref:Uncharacterized protein n=1 Tax=Stephania cephalantha TaxID=152367 RepID=A0AAP0IBT8_9MAGN